jgi:hypothetical protein
MSFSMKSPQIAGLAALLLIASTPAALASPSEIHCRGEFQNVEGQWISTPYCQAFNLASVARDHGMEVSARQIRKNPEKKSDVCRFVGEDNRVTDYCNSDSGSLSGSG